MWYHLTHFTSSNKALEKFKTVPDKFDLIITDMTMPNMTGVDLAARISEIRHDIPIIICTGFSDILNEEIVKSTGIKEHIMKPMDKGQITGTIRKVLDKKDPAS